MSMCIIFVKSYPRAENVQITFSVLGFYSLQSEMFYVISKLLLSRFNVFFI